MSNLSLYSNIVEAYTKYVIDGQLDKFQHVLEASVHAMEGIDREYAKILNEILNDIEYTRFMYSNDEQPDQVNVAMNKLKKLFE